MKPQEMLAMPLDTDPDTDVGHRAPIVCQVAGTSYRTLDYWARSDVVVPSVQRAAGSGSQRLYSFEDIVEVRMARLILDSGRSLRVVRDALAAYRKFRRDRDSGVGVILVSSVSITGAFGSSYRWRACDADAFELSRLDSVTFVVQIDPVRVEVETALQNAAAYTASLVAV